MGAHGEHLELGGNPGNYERRWGRKDKGTVWQEGRGAEVEYCRISPNDTGGLGPSGEKEAFSFQSNPKEESKFRRRYIRKLFPEEIRVEKWGERRSLSSTVAVCGAISPFSFPLPPAASVFTSGEREKGTGRAAPSIISFTGRLILRRIKRSFPTAFERGRHVRRRTAATFP